MKITRLANLALIAALAQGCATTSTSSTTWGESQEPPAWTHYGHVQSVREVVKREDGDPAAGALAGAIIGAFIGGRGPAALFGAAGGTAIGAAASEDHSETRRYDVMVRFDDGTLQTFSYGGYLPFRPGERVVLTPQGLVHG